MPTAVDVLMSPLALLDYAPSLLRDALAGQTLTDNNPLTFKNRASGRDVLERFGVLDQNTEGLDWGDVAGFGAEVAMDPLTYMTFGASALTKAGKAAKKAGTLHNARRVNPGVTKGVAQMRTKLKDVVPEAVEQADQPLSRAVGLGVPFKDPLLTFNVPGGERLVTGMDKVGGAIGSAVRRALPTFRGPEASRVASQAKDVFGPESAQGMRLIDRVLGRDADYAGLSMRASDELPGGALRQPTPEGFGLGTNGVPIQDQIEQAAKIARQHLDAGMDRADAIQKSMDEVFQGQSVSDPRFQKPGKLADEIDTELINSGGDEWVNYVEDDLFQGPAWRSKAAEVMDSDRVPNMVTKDQFMATMKKAGVKDEEIERFGSFFDEMQSEGLTTNGKLEKSTLRQFLDEPDDVLTETVLSDDMRILRDPDTGDSYRVISQNGDDVLLENMDTGHRLTDNQLDYHDVTPEGGAPYKLFTLEGGDNYRVILLRQNNRAPAFQNEHFTEDNILAHLRVTDRADNGSKILHIEELQSDWHQAGKKHGYKTDAPPPKIERQKLRYQNLDASSHVGYDDISPIHRETGEIVQVKDHDRTHLIDPNGNSWPIDEFDYNKKIDAGWDMTPEEREYYFYSERVPEAPFKKSWPLLGMKRAIREAVENGYDEVTWTAGRPLAEVMGLNNTLTKIDHRLVDDSIEVTAWPQDKSHEIEFKVDPQTGRVSTPPDIGMIKPGTPLEEIVGKEIAETIISKQTGTVSGGELVADKGMKGFYDSLLPKTVNKYVKRWGTKAEKGVVDGHEAWRLPITDKMREEVSQGQYLFQGNRPPLASLPDPEDPGRQLLNIDGKEVGETITTPGGFSEENIAKHVLGKKIPRDQLRRINGIMIDEAHRGKGYGQLGYLHMLAAHPDAWHVNSQTLKGATNALKALEKRGLIDIKWDRTVPGWGENGGAHAIRISDKGKQFLAGSQPRGAISFRGPETTITKLPGGDISTLAHESSHLFRRQLKNIDPDLLRDAEKALGVKQGKWTTEAEEAFAEGFEAYLRQGVAADPKLQDVFDDFKVWLDTLYGGEAPTTPADLMSVYDRMLGLPKHRTAPPLVPSGNALLRNAVLTDRNQ